MERDAYLPGFRRASWPQLSTVAGLFLDPKQQPQLWSGGNDNWGLAIWGLDGTDHLPRYSQVGGRKPKGIQTEAHLSFWANPTYGILLHYWKIGGGFAEHIFSRGDFSRIGQWVRTKHDDLSPVGLYIPVETAWLAVKYFMETEGGRSLAIDWVTPDELPDGTFPAPWEHPEVP